MEPGTVVGHLPPQELQEINEHRFAKKHINSHLDTAIRENPESEAKVHQGVALINDWLSYWLAPLTDQTTSEKLYASKTARLKQLDKLEVEQMVRDIYITTMYCQVPTLFVSITSQMAAKMGFDEHADSIRTIAEVVAVLSNVGAYRITKEDAESSLMVENQLSIPHELKDAMDRALYLPPMVCKPEPITNNFESPYLTLNECQILGRGNAHTGDICLDVINKQNAVPMKLALDFLCSVEEEPNPNKPLDTHEKLIEWQTFKRQSYAVYHLVAQQGNQFWLTHKVDKRGRIYAQGYHITSQGSAFKKAALELAHEEIVTGVPT